MPAKFGTITPAFIVKQQQFFYPALRMLISGSMRSSNLRCLSDSSARKVKICLWGWLTLIVLPPLYIREKHHN